LLKGKIYLKINKKLNRKRRKPMKKQVKNISATGGITLIALIITVIFPYD
jgi:hypothetical protein